MKLAIKQYEKAMTGDTGMLCFLGKNYLEQADKQENTVKIDKIFELLELISGRDLPKSEEIDA